MILVFKNRKSVVGLSRRKLIIGVDAAAAAGPIGREATAATDGRLKAEVFSYSRKATRWFPAMVGNHVADIVEKYGSESGLVPTSLTEYIEKRRGYDYSKHGESDNPYLDFISPEIVESFCVLGTPDDHIVKLDALEKAGVTQFNIYLDSGDEENIIATYAAKVIPAING